MSTPDPVGSKLRWTENSSEGSCFLRYLLYPWSHGRAGSGPPEPGRCRKHVPGHLGQHWPGPLWGLAQVVGGQSTKEHLTVPSWEGERAVEVGPGRGSAGQRGASGGTSQRQTWQGLSESVKFCPLAYTWPW